MIWQCLFDEYLLFVWCNKKTENNMSEMHNEHSVKRMMIYLLRIRNAV